MNLGFWLTFGAGALVVGLVAVLLLSIRQEGRTMKFAEARDLIAQTPPSFATKNVVAKGFAILATYGDDLEVAAGHDVIWAGQGALVALVEAMSAEDLRELALLRWFLDDDLGCWGHYV